jgi:cation:H+ antiporter
MIVFWILAGVAGLSLAVWSSGRTLDSAVSLARRLGLSPFIIGMTIIAIGGDLPEIANSITASARGHGDLNVGDSIGSVVTQLTLVAGLLCFLKPVKTERRPVAIAGWLTVLAVLFGAGLMSDDNLSRTDGLLLIGFWGLGTWIVQHDGHVVTPEQTELFERGLFVEVRDLIVGLSGVAVGALLLVQGFVHGAESLGIPEYATSFLVLSLGTSVPELVINGRAIRSGQSSLAIGGIVGSSFVDATISMGIGPALFPTMVSPEAKVGSLIAAVIVFLAISFLAYRPVHDRWSGVVLISLYGSIFSLLLV